jgi:hypothetical protein
MEVILTFLFFRSPLGGHSSSNDLVIVWKEKSVFGGTYPDELQSIKR